MAARARGMRARFDEIRRRHPGEQGRQREDGVREFLREFLPGRLAIGTGEIASANGDVSPQMDVIVYDGHHTPLLDRSESSVVVPVEGVYAVIEVASDLDGSKLRDDVEKIRKAKRLPKTAYFQSGPQMLVQTTSMWGATFDHFPVLGFCFGYESSEIATLRDVVEELDDPDDLGQGVDMVCSLSRGCVVSATTTMDAAGVLTFRDISAAPSPRFGPPRNHDRAGG